MGRRKIPDHRVRGSPKRGGNGMRGWVFKEKNEGTRIRSLLDKCLPDTATLSTWPSSRRSSPPPSTTSAQTSPSTTTTTTSALSTPPGSPLPRPRTRPPAAPPPFRSFARSNRTPPLSSSRNPDPFQHPLPILIRSSPRCCPRASQLPPPLHRATFSPARWERARTHLMFRTWNPRVFSLTMTRTK